MTTFAGEAEVVTGLRLVESDREQSRLGQHRAVRGEFTRLPKAHSAMSYMVRQGLIGHVSVVVGTAIAAILLSASAVTATVVVLMSATWIAFNLATMPAYDRSNSLAPSRRLIVILSLVSLVAVIADAVIPMQVRIGFVALAVTSGLLFVSAMMHRLAFRRVPTLLVGPEDAVGRLSARWEHRKDLVVVGACTWDPDAPMASATLNSVLRDVPRMLHTARGARVVIVAEDAMADPGLRHLAWGLRKAEIQCLILADMHDYVEYVRPTKVGEQLALSLDQPNAHIVSRAIKAISDRVLAGVALILLSPVMMAIAIAIRLDSKGPAIFRQERTGKDGVPFTIYKYRTMIQDAQDQVEGLRELNDGAGPLFKMTEDPRVTRVGGFLRKSSLDELPQLFNVLLGTMSLVGPRPAIESETSQYSPWVWRRLHVKPGMTGLWQVSGRSTLSWDESIRLDLKYVNNWTYPMDIRIMFRTVWVVLNRKGAW
ncbi:MAG: sugar transferase [Actinomycetales bacterium]|nr:sugar transferase [Actinomycetales bacterium]